MANVPAATLSFEPINFAYAATNLAAHDWVFPTNRAQTAYAFPSSNTRQIIVLNTGNNPLLFGLLPVKDETGLPGDAAIPAPAGVPYSFGGASFPNAAAATVVVTEGSTCTRIPVGSSLSIELRSYEERGNMRPVGFSAAAPLLAQNSYPVYLLFFGAVGGDTTADITYVNKFGTF